MGSSEKDDWIEDAAACIHPKTLPEKFRKLSLKAYEDLETRIKANKIQRINANALLIYFSIFYFDYNYQGIEIVS